MDVLDSDVEAAFGDGARTVCGAAGASISERAVRHAADTAAIYLHLQLPEASAYHARDARRAPGRYTPPVRQRLEMGRYVLAEDYVRARDGAEVLRRDVDEALDGARRAGAAHRADHGAADRQHVADGGGRTSRYAR